jgi:hypothetical protein
MAKNGNGEGSIYPHKKNGKKVGYRGAYVVHTAEGPSAATSAARIATMHGESSRKQWRTATRASSIMMKT